MLIHEMTNKECLDALARFGCGRLGCARDNQPYVVPIYFAYHERRLYTFSKAGQKIEWMRANPRVCVEADEITSPFQWLSVVAFGHYEELLDAPEYTFERNVAYQMLHQRAMWWEPAACVAPSHDSTADSLTPIFYRIHIDHVTGHHALPGPVESATSPAPKSAAKSKGRLLSRLWRTRIMELLFVGG